MQLVLPDATTIVTIGMAFLGALFYVASLSMKTVIPLRIAAIASACFFLVYGILAYSVTTIFLYVILVPLNSLRLYQLIQLIKKVRLAAGQDLSMDWLEPFMTNGMAEKEMCCSERTMKRTRCSWQSKGRTLFPSWTKQFRPVRYWRLGFLTSEQRRTQSVECTEFRPRPDNYLRQGARALFENPEFGFYLLLSPASASCKKSHA